MRACGDPPISVVLPDGQELEPAGGESLGRLRIADRKTLWRLAANPLYQFGEAYADGRLEVEGDLGEVLTMIFRRWNAAASGKPVIRPWLRLRWLRKNSPARSRDNIHHHYDIGNDFYELWLDQQLVYTCAYFPTPEVTLEAAQIAKLDHVCKKLRLEPGEHVVEAGCGWGALALHMARHYGVKVTAFNISREQVAYARQRAEREGLSGRVEFVLDDWRSIRQPCDAFVSVGMLEHVGLSNYQQLGAAIGRCLTPSGRGLIHSIGQNQPMPMNPWIERRIFPGAYPPTLRQCMDVLEPHSFTVLDVENLRLHYALTLRHWLARFELASETVKQRFGEKFVRTWWMYLAGSMAAFESGTLQLFQITFARGDCNRVPWTRAELYAQPGASPPGQWAGNK
ncbi:MAG TPA: cyclopropane-fatty-acyl-phospholipid synthase family protein [Pirellulaceae bacterium]|nr:cyclopropane-fatty-acyl-phospholipid synthase family protein [Pirellulaceae bacterium]